MTDLVDLETQVKAKRRELDKQQGQARSLALRGKELQGEIVMLKQQITLHEKVTSLLNTIGEERQQKAQTTIESLVTMGLQTIFGSELSFHLIQRVSGNKAQIEFIIRTTLSDGSIIDTDVMSSRGGGLSSVVGVLLRLVILLLSKPSNSFLVLDESFSHVSAEYLDRVSDFLKEVTTKTNVQIILITHQTELIENADICYRFSLDSEGRTVVTEVDVGS